MNPRNIMGVNGEAVLGFATLSIIAVMILPLPAFLLDLLLSLSISLSLVVFLFALYIERPLEFSAFPSVLLLTTLLRLALNVASSRRILLHGNEGPEAAGKVIEAFGQFVVGGNLVVGVIIFCILIIINFVVITKGAGRIAEVAARFTLDSMPGKQMAIDADLASGLCTQDQAKARRSAVEQEADFFGSMDGAGKFVRGDAVAGLIITFVNIIGGLVVGIAQQHMSAGDALGAYSHLTVGDGLVTQIPALMTSIAAGLVTTRAAAGGSLGAAMARQLFGTRRILYSAAVVLTAMALIPAMPHFAFLLLASVLAALAYKIPSTASVPLEPTSKLQGPEVERAEVESILSLDLVEIEVGYELVPLVDVERDGSLMTRIVGLRKQIAQDLGLIIPPVHMRDNLRLKAGAYRILLSGNLVGESEVRVGKLLAIASSGAAHSIPGEDTVDPAFMMPARWIAQADRQRAEIQGYTVVDAATVIATHLGELLASHASELLGRREVQDLLDIHGRTDSKVIEELIPNVLSMAHLVKVLRNLLRERVSIRDFRTVLEALADSASETKDADLLTEMVRQRLSKQLTNKFVTPQGTLHALVLSPRVEGSFRRMQGAQGAGSVDPAELQALAGDFEAAAQACRQTQGMPVILTSADVRRTVATFAHRYLPTVSVLSFRELDSKINARTVGIIGAAGTAPVRQLAPDDISQGLQREGLAHAS